ncbi:MAG: TetR/AcrR family transcriptional regulator [Actinomycetota bacterium]|nr:TetR/AcrR family transcriptional regulator [Actinomycetota bacterium]
MTEIASSQAGAPRSGAPARGVRLRRDQRRAQLLTAATDIFVSNGYHATVMDEIAEHAGVSKPVLYQHFPGKLELYLALLETHADELVRRVRTAIEETSDNRERVQNAVGAYFDFVDGDGEAFRLVFESDLRNQAAVQELVEQANAACVDAVAQAVVADAGLDAARARLVAVGVVGISEHSARSWLNTSRTVPKDEAVALVAALAWKGLAGFPRQL